MKSSFLYHIGKVISQHLKKELSIKDCQAVSGGGINDCYRLKFDNNQSVFIKLNPKAKSDFFKSEALGLQSISQSQTIYCPKVILETEIDGSAVLALDYLELNSRGDEFLLGQQLAKMHQHTNKEFGFSQDNFIGLTPQFNSWQHSWADFWIEQRIEVQLNYAVDNGYSQLNKQKDRLISAIKSLLATHSPAASLVHGDLWGGNKAFLKDGTPVIFDPACYYGDREVDIAMTHLFGGFGENFYRGYDSIWPLPTDYQQRQILYNLYHQLNHLNLFGGHYLSVCERNIQNLIQNFK